MEEIQNKLIQPQIEKHIFNIDYNFQVKNLEKINNRIINKNIQEKNN